MRPQSCLSKLPHTRESRVGVRVSREYLEPLSEILIKDEPIFGGENSPARVFGASLDERPRRHEVEIIRSCVAVTKPPVGWR